MPVSLVHGADDARFEGMLERYLYRHFSISSKDRLSVETWFLRLRSTLAYIPKSLTRDKVVTNPSRHPSHALTSRLVSFRLLKIVRRDPCTQTCEQNSFYT